MQNRKLGRTSDHRKALLRNLATQLIIHGKLETTEKKAMELRTVMDGLVTLAQTNDFNAKRRAAAYLYPVTNKDGKTALSVLFDEVAPKYAEKKGGYTRVTKLGYRRGDSSPLASIELL